MPTTMSADPICSRRAFNSVGKISSTTWLASYFASDRLSVGRNPSHSRTSRIVGVYRFAEIVHKSGQCGAYAHPVRNWGCSQGIGEELVGRHLQGFREGLHCGLLFVPVEEQAVNHCVSMVFADVIFRHADIAYQQGLHHSSIEFHAFGCQNPE